MKAGESKSIKVRLERIPPVVLPKGVPPKDEDEAKWVRLINGEKLSGWTVDSGDPGRWQAKDGQIIGTGAGSSTRGWLLSDKEYTNFTLRLEFQVAKESDGAVGFRARSGETVGDLPHHLAIKLTRYSRADTPRSGAVLLA